MTASKALWLKNAALRLASQGGQGLDLKASRTRTLDWKLPSGALNPGDQAVVIGASGEIEFLAAQAVTRDGSVRVIENDPTYLRKVEEATVPFQEQLGFTNWRLENAELDDLRTNPDVLNSYLTTHPIYDLDGFKALQSTLTEQRAERPLVEDGSADVVILTAANRLPASRTRLALAEAFRVLRRGGRLIVTVLLADEPLSTLPGDLRYAPEETEILSLLADAGYYGMRYTWRADLPVKVVEGVELRAFVLEAFKGKQGICLDRGHAVVYLGPWREVFDDDGHRYVRGERTAVCEKTYGILMREPYAGQFAGIPCYLEVPVDQAPVFDCDTPQLRDPKVTKGVKSVFDARTDSCCAPSSGCCG